MNAKLSNKIPIEFYKKSTFKEWGGSTSRSTQNLMPRGPSSNGVQNVTAWHEPLAGSTGSTASFLDCLAAALQDLLRRHTPPQALQMSRAVGSGWSAAA